MPTKGSNVVLLRKHREFPAQSYERAPNHPEPPLQALIIDDSPEDRMVVRRALEAQGFTLNEADKGDSGVAAARALKPDCILLDYRLPDLDGFEVLDELRDSNGRLAFAVVMLTGSSNGALAAKFLKVGALDYLSKNNLNADALRLAVRGAAARFQQIQQHSLLHERNAHLATIVDASADAILSLDLDLAVRSWNPAAERLFGYSEADAKGVSLDDLILPPDLRGTQSTHYDAIVSGQEAITVEALRQRRDGSTIDVEITASPIFDREAKVTAISVIIRDVSLRKRSQEMFNFLLGEAEHRSKNLLTIVNAIIQQTAASVAPEVAATLMKRIGALATSHSLFVSSQGIGAELGEIVRAQLAHFGYPSGGRISINGSDLRLSASAAQVLGMAVHELATNAVKYGALSSDQGHVEISWRQTNRDFGDTIELSWIERDGPRVTAPKRRGFGTKILSTMLERSLGGSVTVEYAPEGFRWRFVCQCAVVAESVATQI